MITSRSKEYLKNIQNEVKMLITEHNYAEAELKLNDAFDLDPKNLDTFRISHELERARNNIKSALERSVEMINYYPNYVGGYYRAVRDLIELGSLDEAEVRLNEVHKRNSTSKSYLIMRYRLYCAKGEPESALKIATKYMNLYPNDDWVYKAYQEQIKSINRKHKVPFYITFNDDGLPISHYGVYRGIDIGEQHSIVAVAEAGLYYWNEYLSEEGRCILLSYDWSKWPVNREALPLDKATAVDKHLNCARYILDQSRQKEGYSVWVYPYPFTYNTKENWLSAHAQIVAVQLLIRAYRISTEARYLECFHRSLNAFLVPVEDGGLADKTALGGVWFEKFISEGNDQPKILNGMMFVLLGLYDALTYEKNNQIKEMFELGTESLVKMLPYFDTGKWSAYDIYGRAASEHYHTVHIRQLEALFKITKEPELKKYASRFRMYQARR